MSNPRNISRRSSSDQKELSRRITAAAYMAAVFAKSSAAFRRVGWVRPSDWSFLARQGADLSKWKSSVSDSIEASAANRMYSVLSRSGFGLPLSRIVGVFSSGTCAVALGCCAFWGGVKVEQQQPGKMNRARATAVRRFIGASSEDQGVALPRLFMRR